jgi:hypothetical protein
MQMAGLTDVTKPIVSLHNFAKAPNNIFSGLHLNLHMSHNIFYLYFGIFLKKLLN